MDAEDIRVLQEENEKLKLVIKELTQLTGTFNDDNSLETFRLYDSGCGCCSGSHSYNEAIEAEIRGDTWRTVSAITVLTCFEILNADQARLAE